MDVKTEPRGQVMIVSIIGSLDATTSQALTNSLSTFINAGNVHLVIDLSALDFTSSAGLRALLGALKDCRSKNGDLRIAAVQKEVRKVMELSGFTSILKFFNTVAEGVASFV